MSAWTCRHRKVCPTSSSNPMMERPWCRFLEKHEPASDIDTAVVDSLKTLDPRRPIREADIRKMKAPSRRQVSRAPYLCCAACRNSCNTGVTL